MVGTIYKGDVAEVSWGKETGLIIVGDGSATGFTHTTKGTDSSVITLGNTNYWVTSNVLEYPDNALVGCTLRFTAPTSGNFDDDDYATSRRVYYITANDTTNATITVQPALVTAQGTNGHGDDFITIDPTRCPTFDPAMTDASQQVRTDQFFGLLDNFSLPEPEIDVRKQHIIGMGRDVNVLTSGKETLAGGAFTLNAHTFRWMKYALGGHVAKSKGEYTTLTDDAGANNGVPLNIKKTASAVYTIQQFGASTSDDLTGIVVATNVLSGIATGFEDDHVLIGAKAITQSGANIQVTTLSATHEDLPSTGGIFKVLSSTGSPLYGSFATISSNDLTAVADIDAGAKTRGQTAGVAVYVLSGIDTAIAVRDIRVDLGTTNAAKFSAGDYIQIIDKDTITIPGQDDVPPTLFKNEIRRVIAVSGKYVYVEEPFSFAHSVGSVGVERLQYSSDDARGSPTIDATTKELKFGVEHTIFGDSSLPTFTIEQSFRRNNATPGEEQLLRLYGGCKVNSAGFSANTEGEVKLSFDYESGRHYTDTSGVFNPHRMFENTGNSAVNRKVVGIAVNGEKPYLFQDLNFEAFGRPVLRATQVEFQVSNSNQARHFIRGYSGNTTDSDQVQLGAVQMPLDITEAQRDYTFSFTAMVEDDQLWEQVRTRKHHQNTNDLTLTLKKRGSNSTREDATITIEDYTIIKADHQIPDDKGAVLVNVELAVRHMKIVENSPYYIL